MTSGTGSVRPIRDRGRSGQAFAVDLDRQTGSLSCEDGNGKVVRMKELTYKDFLVAEIRLYFTKTRLCFGASTNEGGAVTRRPLLDTR